MRPTTTRNHFLGSPISCLTTKFLSSCVPMVRDPVDLHFLAEFFWVGLDLLSGGYGVRLVVCSGSFVYIYFCIFCRWWLEVWLEFGVGSF